MTPQEVVAENLLLHAARLPPAIARHAADSGTVPAAVFEQDSDDLYRATSPCTRTADPRAQAAIELLLLVMVADGQHCSTSEIDEIRNASARTGSGRRTTFSFETSTWARRWPTVATPRPAPALIDALLDDIDARITSTVLPGALISAAREVADADTIGTRRGQSPGWRHRSLRLSATVGRTHAGSRATSMRSRPARSGGPRPPRIPRSRAGPQQRAPWSHPISSTSQPPGTSHSPRLADDRADRRRGRPCRRTAPRPAPSRGRTASRSGDRRRDVRRVATPPRRSPRRSARQRRRTTALADPNVAPLAGRCRRGWPGRRRARRRDTSVIHTVGPVEREFGGAATARSHPIPCRDRRHDRTASNDQRRVDRGAGDEFGLGPWDQHPPVDGQVDVPERPLAEHVLERLAGGQPGRPSRRGGRPSASVAGSSRASSELGAARRAAAPPRTATAPRSRPPTLVVVSAQQLRAR